MLLLLQHTTCASYNTADLILPNLRNVPAAIARKSKLTKAVDLRVQVWRRSTRRRERFKIIVVSGIYRTPLIFIYCCTALNIFASTTFCMTLYHESHTIPVNPKVMPDSLLLVWRTKTSTF